MRHVGEGMGRSPERDGLQVVVLVVGPLGAQTRVADLLEEMCVRGDPVAGPGDGLPVPQDPRLVGAVDDICLAVDAWGVGLETVDDASEVRRDSRPGRTVIVDGEEARHVLGHAEIGIPGGGVGAIGPTGFPALARPVRARLVDQTELQARVEDLARLGCRDVLGVLAAGEM